jgi:hypothetical protein
LKGTADKDKGPLPNLTSQDSDLPRKNADSGNTETKNMTSKSSGGSTVNTASEPTASSNTATAGKFVNYEWTQDSTLSVYFPMLLN